MKKAVDAAFVRAIGDSSALISRIVKTKPDTIKSGY